MKTQVLVLLLCFCSTQIFYSQEDDGVVSLTLPVRNTLTFNRFAINPTFSFVREQNKYISFYNKREWVQFDDAPSTYLAGYTGRFAENIGAGISLFQQNYGVLSTFGGVLNFAYNARLTRENNLTFGLNIGAYKSGINTGNVVTNFDDPSLQNVPENFLLTINPGINFGLEFFDFGLSVNNLVAYNFEEGSLLEDNPERGIQGHIMYTGYMDSRGFFDESKFSGLVRSEFKKDETIVSAITMLTVPKGIWAQVGYNTVYGVSGGIGLNITPQIAIEYNFEKTIGDLTEFGPSHDITLAYRFKNHKNYNYSSGDEVSGILSSSTKRKPSKSKLSKEQVEANRKNAAERKAQAQAVLLAKQKAKEETEAQANQLAEQKAKEEAEAILMAEKKAIEVANAQTKLVAEQKAKEEAEAKLLAEQKAIEEAEAQARLLAEQIAKEEAEAKLLAEQEAKEEAELQARLLTEQKAKEEAEAKLLAEQKAKEEAEAQARLLAEQIAKEEVETKLLAEQKAKEEAEAQARILEEQKAKEEAEAKLLVEQKAKEETEREARLLAEQIAKEEAEAKLLAEQKAKEELITNPKDEIGKAMNALTRQAEDLKTEQDELFQKIDNIVEIKNQDLKDLKEENDLSEQGIVKAPKPFKNSMAENNALKTMISDVENVIKSRNQEIKELKKLYDDNFKAGTIYLDEVSLYYQKTIDRLTAEQIDAKQTKSNLEIKLEDIQVATEFERNRRIKRAAFENEEDRYSDDRAILQNIKKTTSYRDQPLKTEDFDFGEEQSSNIQILKNIDNVDSGYYLIIAVHSDIEKRNDFVTKVVASGRRDVDYFYDVRTSKYYIYYDKFDYIRDANEALKDKGNRPYNTKMSLVKIEN